MLGELRMMVTRALMGLRVEGAGQQQQAPQAPVAPKPAPQMHETHLDPDTGMNEMDPNDPPEKIAQAEEDWSRTPRNAPCPCGSGKKYKHCHGIIATEQV